MTTVAVKMPKLGLTMVEGTVVRWLKKEGERVAKGEPLVEVATEKIVTQLESFYDGLLKKILVTEGSVVPVGTAIAEIETDSTEALPEEPSSEVEQQATGQGQAEAREVRATPAARKLARDKGVDLTKVRPSRRDGRITEEDVIAFLRQIERPSQQEQGVGTGVEPVALTPMRRTIARRMKESWEAPHVTVVIEVDAGEVLKLKSQTKIGPFDAIIVKACACALRDYPMLNCAFDGDRILRYTSINIGVAVALDDGLVVPVVLDADKKGLIQVAREIEEMAARAKTGNLQPDELSGGTFTVTNLGMFGVSEFTPLINEPQAAILGVASAIDKPVAKGGSITVRPMMNLCLSFDHRVVDGAYAARFLNRLKELLEWPWQVREELWK